MMLIGYYR